MMIICALLLLLAIIKFAQPESFYDSWVIESLPAWREKLAMCNDGSPFLFFVKKSPTGSNKWHLHLNGGHWAFSPEILASRPIVFTSTQWMLHILDMDGSNSEKQAALSHFWPEFFEWTTGIVDSDPSVNPEFSNWNHVWAYYCSSDGWMGNTSVVMGEKLVHYRGRTILHYLAEHLIDRVFVKTETIQILLSGSSAGGMGALANADYLYNMFKSQFGEEMSFRLLLDSSIAIRDVQPMDLVPSKTPGILPEGVPPIIPVFQQLLMGYPMWNGSLTSPRCPYPPESSYWCVLGHGSAEFISRLPFPVMITAYSADSFALAWATGCLMRQMLGEMAPPGPTTPEIGFDATLLRTGRKSHVLFFDALLHRAKEAFETLTEGNEHDNVSVFVAGCVAHCFLTRNEFLRLRSGQEDTVLMEAVMDWVRGATIRMAPRDWNRMHPSCFQV